MNKTKRFFHAFFAGILAFVLLMIGFLPICQAVRSAHAQEETVGGSIYYFSDSSKSESFCPPYLTNYSVAEEHYWNLDFQATLESNFLDNLFFDGITDSYFIFELSKGFQADQGDPKKFDPLPIVLYDIFEEIKYENRNNKIMLILNSNEALFASQKDFLQFVDIQINIDLMTIFMYSVCDDINKQFEENEYTNIAVFINNYLTDTYFYYAEQKTYFDFYINSYPFKGNVLFNPLYKEALETDWKCAVGYADNWAYFSLWMDTMCNEYLVDKAYVYDEIGWSGDYDYTEIFYCPDAYGVLTGTFSDILWKFMNDDDLSGYNNFDGTADINYLPALFGEDGWMKLPSSAAVRQWDMHD